jgi:DNA-binding NtrC family response regulator
LDAQYVVTVTDGTELRHRVHEHQPDIVLLDSRVGGNGWRAIDEVPALVERTATHPYVIAMLPKTSSKIEREAARRECYDVVNASASRFLRDLVEAVSSAKQARASRQRERRAVKKESLH